MKTITVSLNWPCVRLCLSPRHTMGSSKIEKLSEAHESEQWRCKGYKDLTVRLCSYTMASWIFAPSSQNTSKQAISTPIPVQCACLHLLIHKRIIRNLGTIIDHPYSQPTINKKMGCTHSVPSMAPTDELQRPVPSRPRPTHSLFYKYHRRPRLPRRYENACENLKASSRKHNGEWDDIESCSMTSLKIWVRQYDCEAGLRWANGGETGG